MGDLVAVEVEHGVQLRERQGAVAPQDLLGDVAQSGTGQRSGVDRHRRHPAGAGLGRPTGADPGHRWVQLVVEAECLVQQLTPGLQPRLGVTVELVEAFDAVAATLVGQVDAVGWAPPATGLHEGRAAGDGERDGERAIGAGIHGWTSDVGPGRSIAPGVGGLRRAGTEAVPCILSRGCHTVSVRGPCSANRRRFAEQGCPGVDRWGDEAAASGARGRTPGTPRSRPSTSPEPPPVRTAPDQPG